MSNMKIVGQTWKLWEKHENFGTNVKKVGLLLKLCD